jgi:hypothetical protein
LNSMNTVIKLLAITISILNCFLMKESVRAYKTTKFQLSKSKKQLLMTSMLIGKMKTAQLSKRILPSLANKSSIFKV